jgi:hypothetical protein
VFRLLYSGGVWCESCKKNHGLSELLVEWSGKDSVKTWCLVTGVESIEFGWVNYKGLPQ